MESRVKTPLPSQEEFNNWRIHPVTQAVLDYLQSKVTELQLDWVNGAFTGPGPYETLQMNSEAIGRGQAFALLIDLDLADLESKS